MRAYMSNPNVERAADWPAHAFAQPTAAKMALREASAILAETGEGTMSERSALGYASAAYLRESHMPASEYMREALKAALAAFVAEVQS